MLVSCNVVDFVYDIIFFDGAVSGFLLKYGLVAYDALHPQQHNQAHHYTQPSNVVTFCCLYTPDDGRYD
jgi:hypothetical protein